MKLVRKFAKYLGNAIQIKPWKVELFARLFVAEDVVYVHFPYYLEFIIKITGSFTFILFSDNPEYKIRLQFESLGYEDVLVKLARDYNIVIGLNLLRFYLMSSLKLAHHFKLDSDEVRVSIYLGELKHKTVYDKYVPIQYDNFYFEFIGKLHSIFLFK